MKHIGFIMDGNRTWAKENGLTQLEWHRHGYNNVEKIIDECLKKKIEFVSFWALSDDNIRERSVLEVKYLFDLLTKGIRELIEKANEKNLILYFVGDRKLLREDCLDAIISAESETKNNTGMKVIFAIGYGGQEEIVRAIQKVALEKGDLKNISKHDILNALDTGNFPPPDMIVRTGGHMRHSGFLLFQSPYAEYYFSQKNWPDFDEEECTKVFDDFQKRKRKFWK